MSLAIDVDTITKVLLADGWHTVHNQSFTLDSYEYLADPHTDHRMVLHGGGQSDVSATGFQFVADKTGELISGPLTAILAVRHTER